MRNGPDMMSGPCRVDVRVREIVPMWRTAQTRSSSPTTTSADADRHRPRRRPPRPFSSTTTARPSGTGSHER